MSGEGVPSALDSFEFGIDDTLKSCVLMTWEWRINKPVIWCAAKMYGDWKYAARSVGDEEDPWDRGAEAIRVILRWLRGA